MQHPVKDILGVNYLLEINKSCKFKLLYLPSFLRKCFYDIISLHALTLNEESTNLKLMLFVFV